MNLKIDISNVMLQTDRLVLRPWRASDLSDFYEYASVDGVGQMAGWTPHRTMEESGTILDRFIQGKHVFALVYHDKVIGSLGIEQYREDHYPELDDFCGCEIGYVLSRDYWGKGLMPEAVQAAISWLFRDMGLDFVLVGHFDWNAQSRRVIEKCGFRYMKTTKYKTRYDTVENSMEYILWKNDIV